MDIPDHEFPRAKYLDISGSHGMGRPGRPQPLPRHWVEPASPDGNQQ